MEFPQELSDRSVVFRGFKDKIGEILRNEKIVSQRLLDRFGNLVALRLEVLHVELRLIRIGEVPALNDGKAVKSLLQDVPQFALVLPFEPAILGGLRLPFLGLQYGTGHDDQIAVEKGIGRFRTRDHEANRVTPLLQMIFYPSPETLIELVGLLWQDKNR